MFCSKCGKKVLDSMLFCPFCGAGIVIPDQEKARGGDVPQESEAADAPETLEAEALPREDMSWMDPPEAGEEPSPAAPEPFPTPVEEEARPDAAELHRTSRRPEGYRVPVPPKPPEDLFLDAEDEADDVPDAYDAFEAAYERSMKRRPGYSDDDDLDDEDDDDEDAGEGFFMRHLRGIIALLMLVALLGGLVVYALTDSGQTLLARANLDLPIIDTKVFMHLGYEEYQAGNYSRAGAYYEKALSREPGSYDYAQSAAMAYMAQKDVDGAARMLVKCAELRPDAVEPYLYLMDLYPNAQTRPAEITVLLQQGYQRTGDARLNITTTTQVQKG